MFYFDYVYEDGFVSFAAFKANVFISSSLFELFCLYAKYV